MSPFIECSVCDDTVIGDEKYGCPVCKRTNISKELHYQYHLKCMKKLPLPDDLLRHIANLTISIQPTPMVVLVNNCAWRSQNHADCVYVPHFLTNIKKKRVYCNQINQHRVYLHQSDLE